MCPKELWEACQTSDLGQSMDEPIGEEEGTRARCPPLEVLVLLLLSLGDPTNWMRVQQMRVDLADETPSVLDAWILAQKTIMIWMILFFSTIPLPFTTFLLIVPPASIVF
jgi:hypothetical protein